MWSYKDEASCLLCFRLDSFSIDIFDPDGITVRFTAFKSTFPTLSCVSVFPTHTLFIHPSHFSFGVYSDASYGLTPPLRAQSWQIDAVPERMRLLLRKCQFLPIPSQITPSFVVFVAEWYASVARAYSSLFSYAVVVFLQCVNSKA